MPNAGFRGNTVQIQKLSIEAGSGGVPMVRCSVQFAAEDGTVHAVAEHNFILDLDTESPNLAELVRSLFKEMTKKVETIHFEKPSDHMGASRGISELLRDSPAAPDEPGTQA